MNRVCLTGTIKSVTELLKTKYDTDMIKFTLSVSDDDGRDIEPTITAYGEPAREIHGRLKPGNLVYFEGSYSIGKYGGFIIPKKIERMLGNKSQPESIILSESKKESMLSGD